MSSVRRLVSHSAKALAARAGLYTFLFRRSPFARSLGSIGRRLRFWVNRRIYSHEEEYGSAREGTRATFGLLALSRGPFLFAALVVLALTYPQPWLNDQLSRVGLRGASASPVEGSVYVTLLTTVAAAAAGLLALFFTTVGVIVSTAYTRVTTDVRLLILNDVLNRRFLRLNAHTAAVATLGLVVYHFQATPSTALVLYVAAVASICLLAFFPVGIRVFALFDSSSLLAAPSNQIRRAITCVQAGHRRWNDPSFQVHARKGAQHGLRTLHDLGTLALEEGRATNSAPLALVQFINHLARTYANAQRAIPSESLWFPRKARYARWQTSDSSQTRLALATGTMQAPEQVPDRGFLHDTLRQITTTTFVDFLNKGYLTDAAALLLETNKTATAYAIAQDQGEAQALILSTQAGIVDWLLSDEPKTAPDHDVLAVVDVQCVCALAPILNTSLALCGRGALPVIAVEQQLADPTGVSLYRAKHPRPVLLALEDLRRRISFERDIDAPTPTAAWFIRHFTAVAYADYVREVVRGIVSTVETSFVTPAATLVEKKAWLPAGFWLLRSIEACTKAEDQFAHLDSLYADLKTSCAFEMDWTPSGTEEARQKIKGMRKKILVHFSAVMQDLATLETSDSLPDIVGDVRAKLGDQLVDMMAAQDPDMESFGKMFITYLNASFVVTQRLAADARQSGRDHLGSFAFDALLDLLDLSGIALLFSELDGTGYAPIVRAAWDARASKVADPPAFVRLCYAVLEARLNLPALSAGAMQRQRWNQQFVHSMAARGVEVDEDVGTFVGENPRARHSSPVIESIHAMLGHMFTEPSDYFGALYLAKTEAAAGVTPPSSVTECLDDLERAAERVQETGET